MCCPSPLRDLCSSGPSASASTASTSSSASPCLVLLSLLAQSSVSVFFLSAFSFLLSHVSSQEGLLRCWCRSCALRLRVLRPRGRRSDHGRADRDGVRAAGCLQRGGRLPRVGPPSQGRIHGGPRDRVPGVVPAAGMLGEGEEGVDEEARRRRGEEETKKKRRQKGAILRDPLIEIRL
jgi:hypothetical protein